MSRLDSPATSAKLVPPGADPEVVADLHRVLAGEGIVAALRVMNGRTPHRYTGIYKYTPKILRNLYLVDAFDPDVTRGGDVPNEDAYCVLLRDANRMAFAAIQDANYPYKPASPVVSYCGVLLMRANGQPFGSLCHYDVARCQEPITQMPYLEAMAPHIVAMLEAEGH
ncbi:MAG TPA: hypothetical protein VIG54_01420 [Lysobacter sp.]